MEEVITVEEIAQHYSAMLDSVKLLEGGNVHDYSDEDWLDTVGRNKRHLELMLAKDFWTDEDMSSIEAVVAE